MDVHRLRSFLAVAEELHFGRAAEKLRITPSPLSKQIKLLERELGGELFNRRYHEVTLTPRAAALVEPIRELLQQIDALPGIGARAAGETALRVGITVYAPARYVKGFVDALRDLPKVEISTVFSDSVDLCKDIHAGVLDAALIHFPPPDASLASKVLGTYGTGLAFRADDPLAERDQIQQADLFGREITHVTTSLHPELFRRRLSWLSEAGVSRFIDAPPGLSEKATLIQTLGVVATVLDPHDPQVRRAFEPAIVMRPVPDPRLDMTLGLVWSQENALNSPELQAMLDYVCDLKVDAEDLDSSAAAG